MGPFFLGLIVGIITSAPIGPVGLLTIQRTLSQGRFAGLLSGAGAATADAFYGGLAGLGLSAVAGFLAHQRLWIHIAAGVLCLWFGLRAMFFRPRHHRQTHSYSGRGLLWNYASAILLTLANPLTILFFIVVFTALHLDHVGLSRLLLTVAGIFAGCLAWWTGLTLTTARLHTHLHARTLVMINRVSAVVIIGVGVAAIATAIHIAAFPARPLP
ncbi:MAG: LysE family translocator [Acidiferrobacter sp.]